MALNIIYRGKNNPAPTFLKAPIDLEDELNRKDHFIVKDGVTCAGTHVIIDLWDATELDSLEAMEAAMREAVEVCGATLLHIHLHHFTPNGGVSGVAVLAESHISVHSWPERGFAAFDVFMCGDAKPELAVDVFRKHFNPRRVEVHQHLRGTVGSSNGTV